MQELVNRLSRQLNTFHALDCEEGHYSIPDLLWDCYLQCNPVDDGRIRAAERALKPVFAQLSMKNADLLSDLVSDLCIAYQRAAFLEGLHAGVNLMDTLRD